MKMKKNILLLSLSLSLVGNVVHAGIASKAAKTLYWGALFAPAMFIEAGKIAIAKDIVQPDIEQYGNNINVLSCTLDTRPWGEVTYWVNPKLLPWKKDLYDALETTEKAIIHGAYVQKITAILVASPIAAHIITSPLARIQHPIAKIARTISTVGLCLSATPWFEKQFTKEADLSIKNPRQISAYIDHLQQTGTCSKERIDYLKQHLREMQAQQRG